MWLSSNCQRNSGFVGWMCWLDVLVGCVGWMCWLRLMLEECVEAPRDCPVRLSCSALKCVCVCVCVCVVCVPLFLSGGSAVSFAKKFPRLAGPAAENNAVFGTEAPALSSNMTLSNNNRTVCHATLPHGACVGLPSRVLRLGSMSVLRCCCCCVCVVVASVKVFVAR